MPILTAEERVGTLLAGRYRLESILGSGGTSVVYRASHAWTARSVAVKLLKPEHARDRGLVMRFLREARTASTLVHPNVVTILDMGTDPAGDVYLAMELLTGDSLGAVLDREGRLGVTRAGQLLRPIMEAIACAHARGIVHRDVKPDNVLIGDRGDGVTRSILLDFGMAKMTEAAWGHATQSGLIVGTPFYMSPEQAEGASDVGTASDVWSMGVLWYRCLAGALPFFASAPTALLLAIARGDHVPLRERAPDVPEAIASVIERALRVERADRYADMKEMLAALDRALAGHVDSHVARTALLASTVSPPLRSEPELAPGDARDAGPRWGRHAVALAIGALAILAAIAGGAMSIATDEPEVAAIAPPPPVVSPPAPASLAVESPIADEHEEESAGAPEPPGEVAARTVEARPDSGEPASPAPAIAPRRRPRVAAPPIPAVASPPSAPRAAERPARGPATTLDDGAEPLRRLGLSEEL